MKLLKFIKDWILIFAIISGVAGYFAYVNIPCLDSTRKTALATVELIQPMLIFSMLFLTFCKINPKKLKLCEWHWWLLAFQSGIFLVLGAIVMTMPRNGMRIILEGAMICFICPVATAGAVVTKKLGGNAAHITTYTILINLVAATIIPAVIPFVHPQPAMSALGASALILGKVFPLLLFPLLLALLIRKALPRLHFTLSHYQGLAFYLWVVALTLATAVTTRFIVHSHVPLSVELGLVGVALVSCILQFMTGWKIGRIYGDKVTAGQSLGQKNTVLAIWIGYTFFTPITSVAGGFYSIFHNVINSYQLYMHANRNKHA
ncbi:transporter [Xylanibacter muris]|uniref:Transporter n=1 Tax=Xylanibacter muris TaxID=2736290 RepID=A0ABX2ASP8_9BACT|nr:transporter [Xylanibacter muris]NPD93052.1 transporter [Xylanibacter muris]